MEENRKGKCKNTVHQLKKCVCSYSRGIYPFSSIKNFIESFSLTNTVQKRGLFYRHRNIEASLAAGLYINAAAILLKSRLALKQERGVFFWIKSTIMFIFFFVFYDL